MALQWSDVTPVCLKDVEAPFLDHAFQPHSGSHHQTILWDIAYLHDQMKRRGYGQKLNKFFQAWGQSVLRFGHGYMTGGDVRFNGLRLRLFTTISFSV